MDELHIVEGHLMFKIVGMLLTIYLIGVAVALAPTIQANWRTASMSLLGHKIAADLPKALGWPMTAYGAISGVSRSGSGQAGGVQTIDTSHAFRLP